MTRLAELEVALVSNLFPLVYKHAVLCGSWAATISAGNLLVVLVIDLVQNCMVPCKPGITKPTKDFFSQHLAGVLTNLFSFWERNLRLGQARPSTSASGRTYL